MHKKTPHPDLAAYLIAAIQKQLPPHVELAGSIEQVLGISRNALYKRLRRASAFTADELVALARHFQISLDHFVLDKPGIVSMDFPAIAQPMPSATAFLAGIDQRLASALREPEVKLFYASAEIPLSERHKVEQIAIAMRRLLRRSPREIFLIEGHTDAVGSHENNYRLSVRRAASLKRALVRYFGIPSDALETAGYGEDFLLVQTPHEEWRNRRVTLRRITDFVLR